MTDAAYNTQQRIVKLIKIVNINTDEFYIINMMESVEGKKEYYYFDNIPRILREMGIGFGIYESSLAAIVALDNQTAEANKDKNGCWDWESTRISQ